ncbi:MAG: SMC-Scp complex subunit ScpB [Candidatus Krumholzibacteriia bacterium]
MDENTDTGIDDRSIEREVEALLFASDIPLAAAKLAALTGAPSSRRVLEAIGALSRFYGESGRGFTIVEVAGGYQLTTLPEFSGVVSRLFKGRKKAKLTLPALETLAIVAYKQPISRMQIEAIRGVNCDGVLATLIEREVISISGRGEGIGKPYLYSTTKKFLEYMGLKDFGDLPSLDELERRFAFDAEPSKPLVPPPGNQSDDGGAPDADGQ